MQQSLVQTETSLREVHDTIYEMIKESANEPSVGLYFVQQHVHRAVPSMDQLKTQIVDTTREAEYVTQDVRDTLNSVRSMKESTHPGETRYLQCLDELPPDSSARPRFLADSPDMPRNISRSPSGRGPPVTDSAYTGYVRTIFDYAYPKASNVANVSNWTSSGTSKVSTSALERKDDLEVPATSNRGDEAQSTTSNVGRPPFWFPDSTRPGEYVRGLFKVDGLQPHDSWAGWLPTQALRSGLSKISGGKVREEAVTNEPPPEVHDSTRDLLQLEGDSYAAFASERAAELEQCLDDTEGLATKGP